jgi:hypothetical protein
MPIPWCRNLLLASSFWCYFQFVAQLYLYQELSTLIGFVSSSILSIISSQVVSKPTLSFLGTVNAFMGSVFGIGFGAFIGLEFNQIVNIMPFLVVCTLIMFVVVRIISNL